MFFGATSFSSTPFAGVGITNIVVNATGNQINVAIGNTKIQFVVPVTGKGFILATSPVSVVSWNPIPPNVNQIWIPIDPDNP